MNAKEISEAIHSQNVSIGRGAEIIEEYAKEQMFKVWQYRESQEYLVRAEETTERAEFENWYKEQCR